MADTTTELEVLNQIVDVLGGQSGQHETVVPVLQQIKELLAAGITDPEAIAEAVAAWLDEHPEATTTVQDGSITGVKIADDTIPDAKLAQTGGVLSQVNDIRSQNDVVFSSAGDVMRTQGNSIGELLDTNVLYHADSISILNSDGTAPAYVYHDIAKKYGIAVGDTFGFSVESTTAPAANPVYIHVKRANGTNVRYVRGARSCTTTITQADLDDGAVCVCFTLYPAQGTGPLAEAAVFNGVDAYQGVKKFSKVGGVIADEISHMYTSTVLYSADSVTLSGTSVWVQETVHVESGISAGDYFEFACDSVTGSSSANRYLCIYVDSEDTSASAHIAQVFGGPRISVRITDAMIAAGAIQARFLLYPAQGTALPTGSATFTGVVVHRGKKPYIVGDYMASMLADTMMPYLSDTVKTVAHRGDDVDAPQCVTAAYVAARKHRHTIVENDLNKTVDGVYVMWHDTSLSRLGTYVTDVNGYQLYTGSGSYYWYDAANGTVYDAAYDETSVPISQLTACAGANYGVADYESVVGLPYDVLKNIDFGAYMGFSGQRLLTFEEWVLLCKQLGVEMYIDKKIALDASDMAAVFNIVNRLGMKDKTSWVLWTTTEADALRALDPNARIIVLVNPSASAITTWGSYNTGRGLVFNGDGKETTREQVTLGLDAGFEVEAWYVDVTNVTEEAQLARIRELVSYGVTGLSLDHYRVDEAFAYLFA